MKPSSYNQEMGGSRKAPHRAIYLLSGPQVGKKMNKIKNQTLDSVVRIHSHNWIRPAGLEKLGSEGTHCISVLAVFLQVGSGVREGSVCMFRVTIISELRKVKINIIKEKVGLNINFIIEVRFSFPLT